eukprot:COSAG06_NODE_33320_length_491_cov_4.933673_1_plen_85_part_10
MTTLFKAPQIGEPRATGVKNGGVQSYDQRVIHPVSRIVDDAFTPGKQIEFRWRSEIMAYVAYAVIGMLLTHSLGWCVDDDDDESS